MATTDPVELRRRADYLESTATDLDPDSPDDVAVHVRLLTRAERLRDLAAEIEQETAA